MTSSSSWCGGASQHVLLCDRQRSAMSRRSSAPMACITSANGGTAPVIIIRRGARYASRADGEAWHDLPRNGDHAAAAEFQLDGIAGGIVARVDNRGRSLGASVAARARAKRSRSFAATIAAGLELLPFGPEALGARATSRSARRTSPSASLHRSASSSSAVGRCRAPRLR